MTRTAGRHARTKPQRGPITQGIAVISKREPWIVAALLRLWPLIPALFLIVPILRHGDVEHFAGLILGLDATLCLIACITVTPLMTVIKARAAKLRWWYGIWMFTLGTVGLGITLWMGRSDVSGAAGGNSVNWTGLLLVVLLAPMVATSNVAAQKALGPEWKRWQRWLVWTVWGIVVIHLAALAAWWPPLGAFLAATLPLIYLRRQAKHIKAWRMRGYDSGGWWVMLAICVVSYLAGTGVLTGELAVACGQAVS